MSAQGVGIEEVRIRLLRPGQRLLLPVGAGTAIMCCAGSMRVTQAGNPKAERHILVAGHRFVFNFAGVALLTALDGMKGEWLEDTGIVLFSAPAALG